MCAEWVGVRARCVLCAPVCAWGGVSAPEPVGCAAGEEEAGEVPPACLCRLGDLGRDRER